MAKAGRDILTVAPVVPARRRVNFAALLRVARKLASGELLQAAFWRLDGVLVKIVPWLIGAAILYVLGHVFLAVAKR